MNSTINEISIRFVNEEDLLNNKDNIIYLLNQNYEINLPDMPNAWVVSSENYENMILYLKKNMAIIIGAFYNDTIVGFLWAYEKIFLNVKRYHLGHIIINENYRKKSIGRKLIAELEKSAEENSVDTIELMATPQNTDTMLFYETLGFKIERVQLHKKTGDKYDYK